MRTSIVVITALLTVTVVGCARGRDVMRSLPGHYQFEAIGERWAGDVQARRGHLDIDKDGSIRAVDLPEAYAAARSDTGRIVWDQSNCDPFEDLFGTYCLSISWDGTGGESIDRAFISKRGRAVTLDRSISGAWVTYRAVD